MQRISHTAQPINHNIYRYVGKTCKITIIDLFIEVNLTSMELTTYVVRLEPVEATQATPSHRCTDPKTLMVEYLIHPAQATAPMVASANLVLKFRKRHATENPSKLFHPPKTNPNWPATMRTAMRLPAFYLTVPPSFPV